MYTFPSVVINDVTYTAQRFGQSPSITYDISNEDVVAGSEIVVVANDLSNITIFIEDGASTNLQIKNAIAASMTTVQSLFARDLVTVAIADGHNSDVNTEEGPDAMTGGSSVPAPSDDVAVIPARPITLDYNVDWSLNSKFYRTLSANTTITFTNAADGMEIVVVLTNTASNRTVAWPSGIQWVGGSAPTQTVGAKSDVYTFRKLGTVIYGTAVQNLS